MGRVCAVILAGGKGTRMLADINKQFLNINSKPMIFYTLNAFQQNKNVDDIVLVASKYEIDYCKRQIVEKNNFTKVVKIVSGGLKRQDSVINGLEAIDNCDIVLIHDGARPFINDSIIDNGIKFAKQFGAAACGVNPKDTIKVKAQNGFACKTLDRSTLFNVQTPQCFEYDLILNSHRKVKKDNVTVTDDTMVAEYCGHRVYLYEGSYNNIKITTPEDLIIAENIFKKL